MSIPVPFRRSFAGVLLLAGLFGKPSPGGAQEDARVLAARELAEAGRWTVAADTLRSYLRDHPDDPGARWMLGRLLYWLEDHAAAHAEYEAALRLRPDDAWIRLGHAWVLVALGDWERAREGLRLVVEDAGAGGVRAEATALLGSLAWWSGDAVRAVARYREALELDPGQPDARAGLDEIALHTRPWVTLGIQWMDDNQPRRRGAMPVEAGVWVTPLWAVTAALTPRTLGGDRWSTDVDGVVGITGYVPAIHVETSAEAGAVTHRGEGGGSTWVGSAATGLRLGPDTRLRARGWRERYDWTRTSLDTLLMVEGLELALDRAGAPGWAGELVGRRERFPDGNRVRTAYAWVLAPLLPWLRAGYAVSWQDADESRWVPTGDDGPGFGPPGGGPPLPGDATAGHYDPYFTPEETVVHGLLAEGVIPVGGGTARLDLNVGIHAQELAPFVAAAGPALPVRVDFASRTFRPWRLGAAADLPLGRALALRAELERQETAFYRVDRLKVELRARPGWFSPVR